MNDSPLTRLRYAVIGCGGVIAPTHLQALAHVPDAQIVAMSDLDTARGAPRAEAADVPFFTDYRAMLAEIQPDVAVICVPHPFHAPIALDCFKAGAHVLVEKPIAVEVAEADTMIAAAEAAGRWLAVSFQFRFRPEAAAARALIERGELGDLVRVLAIEPWFRPAAYYQSAGWRGSWRGEGGGVLMNQGPHGLDMLCYLAGLPKRVWGWTRTRAHTIEVEDTAQAMLEFENGAPGYLYFSTVEAGAARQLQIVGDRASIELEGTQLTIRRFDQPLSEFLATSKEMFAAPKSQLETPTLPTEGGGHLAVYLDLQQAIRTGKPPLVHGSAGRQSLELANAITLSSHLGQPVDLPIDRAAYHELLVRLQSS